MMGPYCLSSRFLLPAHASLSFVEGPHPYGYYYNVNVNVQCITTFPSLSSLSGSTMERNISRPNKIEEQEIIIVLKQLLSTMHTFFSISCGDGKICIHCMHVHLTKLFFSFSFSF